MKNIMEEASLASHVVFNAIKELLETKHLYQHIEIDKKSLLPENSHLRLLPKIIWLPYLNPELSPNTFVPFEGGFISFFPHDSISLFCRKCKTTSPYNVVYMDYPNWPPNSLGENYVEDNNQIFVFMLECQGCRSIPEVVMIHRQGMKLTLCGRSPLEIVKVSDFIPVPQKKHYSDAILAYNSGQVLPGICMLRIFIEQYVRDVTQNPSTINIDKIFDTYKDLLPDDFKQRVPSLYDIYGKLSEDIHSATGSNSLFTQALKDINLHFEAKVLFDRLNRNKQ